MDELVAFLSSSLEQMNLILRIFREPLLHATLLPDSTDITVSPDAAVVQIFTESLDFYNNFRLLLDYLESDGVEEEFPPGSLPSSSSTAAAATSSSQQAPPPTSPGAQKSMTSEHRRLVGRLFEPADDIALAGYASSPERFASVWRLSERPEVIESLGRLSRAIVHTVSRLKATTSDSLDPRLLCLHSLCCPSCRAWDCQKETTVVASSPGSDGGGGCGGTTPTHPSPSPYPPASHCNSVVNCFRYLLPRLLLLPIFQFFQFYRLVNVSLPNTRLTLAFFPVFYEARIKRSTYLTRLYMHLKG